MIAAAVQMNGERVTVADEPRLTLCNTPELLAKYSPVISPWLYRLEKHTDGFYTAKRVAERFAAGEWQCWVVLAGDECKAVGGTVVYLDDSGRKVCKAEFIEGADYRDWFPFMEVVRAWAIEQNGCDQIFAETRKGHHKFAFQDWKLTHYRFEWRPRP